VEMYNKTDAVFIPVNTIYILQPKDHGEILTCKKFKKYVL
jgi:hypothetical protein